MAESTTANNDIEAQRSSSDDDGYPNKKCKHVKDSVNVKTLKKKVPNMKPSDIECVTCAKNNESSSPPFTPTIESISTDDSTPRGEDSSSSKDAETLPKQIIQICLACGETHCGRDDKKHAVKHFEENNDHTISLNLESSEAWCYKCDEFVVPSTNRNQVVAEAQSLIRKHLNKTEKNYEEEEEQRELISRKRGKINSYQVTAPGLNNLGNTCFFNSVMQVVVGTSVLHDILLESDPYYDPPHIDVSKCITAKEEVGPLTDEFKSFLRKMWETRTRNSTVSPGDLFSQISKKWQQFRGWRQQDSQELMRFLFDGVKSEELEHIKKLELENSRNTHYMETENDDEHYDDDDDDDYDDSYKESKDVKKYESFIDACFGGKLVSVIVCDVCKNCSYSYEEFLDVSLPIKSSSKNSFGYSDFNSGYGYGYNSGSSYFMNDHKSNDGSTKSDDGSGNGGEDENQNEEESSDTEKEEGIPVPTKEARERIKLLLRDLPSGSGRSTPSSKDVTLLDCLKSFVKVETLEGDNSFACDNCWKLKKEYDEQQRDEANGTDSTDDAADTGDTNDKDDKTQVNGLNADSEENGTCSQDGDSNMEGVVYNADIKRAEEAEAETDSTVLGNENSSDTSDGASRSISNLDNDNFLTATKSKPASQPERKYILRKAYKRYLFDSLPPVMVFHLKRFQQVGGRWSVSMRKIDDFVAFEEELDIGHFVVPPEIEEKNEENGINNGHIIDNNSNIESSPKQTKQHKLSTKYRLYGVVVHLGSLYNGHYIAYVLSRNIRGEGEQYGVSSLLHGDIDRVREIERQIHKTDDQREWIYCSDSSVRAATADEVLGSGAYLLFYERVHE